MTKEEFNKLNHYEKEEHLRQSYNEMMAKMDAFLTKIEKREAKNDNQ